MTIQSAVHSTLTIKDDFDEQLVILYRGNSVTLYEPR